MMAPKFTSPAQAPPIFYLKIHLHIFFASNHMTPGFTDLEVRIPKAEMLPPGDKMSPGPSVSHAQGGLQCWLGQL